MALIKITHLEKTLDTIQDTLHSAMKGDGMVSRADFRDLLNKTEDPLQKRFLEIFYSFLIKLEDRPRMRVTKEIIEKGIIFIQEQIIPHFEVKEQFTLRTNQEIAQIHPSAFPMTMELLRFTSSRITLSPLEVSEQIASLTEDLFFDDYGSEAAMNVKSFFLEHDSNVLSSNSFVQAMGLDPLTPKGKVERFDPADQVLLTFVEQHLRSGHYKQARSVVELMNTNLSDLRIIIVGEDNHPDLESNHPVYVVGIGQNGNLAGFQSIVIWT